VGSAPIAHSAVKTSRPASEGLVALLEPFIDTVVVCTMTALVIISTGMWNVKADALTEINLTQTPGGTEIVSTLEAGTKLHFLNPTDEDNDKLPDWWEKKYADDLATFNGELDADFDKDEYPDSKELENRTNPADKSDQGENGKEPFWYLVKEYKGEATGWVATDQVRLRDGWGGGIWLTSESFKTVISWFPYVLAIAVFLFAFSTMISWSYYAEQAVIYLFGNNRPVVLAFKLIFCGFIVVGAAASLGNVIRLADALFFCMVVPNLVGVYVLLPVVKKELSSYLSHVKKVDERSAD